MSDHPLERFCRPSLDLSHGKKEGSSPMPLSAFALTRLKWSCATLGASLNAS
jgi:hypothetical protein